MRAREYQPETGRFLETDPIEAGAGETYLGVYIYADDEPTLKTDPSGMCIPLTDDIRSKCIDLQMDRIKRARKKARKRAEQTVNVHKRLLSYIDWSVIHRNSIATYISGGGKPITWKKYKVYKTPLSFPHTDCSGFVTFLYLWAARGAGRFDPNGERFAGDIGDAYTGKMAYAKNGRDVYVAADSSTTGKGNIKKTRKGDIAVWGPTDDSAHVVIFAQNWHGSSTMVLSHGQTGTPPHYVSFAAVDSGHSWQRRWIRTSFP